MLNAGAKIINVQWDFDYGKRFTQHAGLLVRARRNKEPALQAQYEFPAAGNTADRLQGAGRHGRRGLVDRRDRGELDPCSTSFAQYEDAFRDWRRDGMPGLKRGLLQIHRVSDLAGRRPGGADGTLWPHQWESFLRVVYAHEILGKAEIGADGLLLNIVTGGGKTAIIAALIAWLRIAHDVQKFVMLCPNLIVRDRLEDDFEGGKVFKDRDLLPDWGHCAAERFRADDARQRQGGRLGELAQRQRHPGQHPPVLSEQQERAEQSVGADERAGLRPVQRRGAQLAGAGIRGDAASGCERRSFCEWTRRRRPTAPTARRPTAT